MTTNSYQGLWYQYTVSTVTQLLTQATSALCFFSFALTSLLPYCLELFLLYYQPTKTICPTCFFSGMAHFFLADSQLTGQIILLLFQHLFFPRLWTLEGVSIKGTDVRTDIKKNVDRMGTDTFKFLTEPIF